MTVIKTERPKKKATAHICTDSVGGLVTIYYDLSEQLTIPCEVIQISFFSPNCILETRFSLFSGRKLSLTGAGGYLGPISETQ